MSFNDGRSKDLNTHLNRLPGFIGPVPPPLLIRNMKFSGWFMKSFLKLSLSIEAFAPFVKGNLFILTN